MRRLFLLLVLLWPTLLASPRYAQAQSTVLYNSNVVIVGHENTCTSGPSGGTDAYACTFDRAITAYVTKACYKFTADVANVGPATLNLHSLGAKTIKKVQGGITTDLGDNDIRTGQIVTVCYDGQNFQCQNCAGNTATGSTCTPYGSSKALTNNTAIPILSATVANGSVHASQVRYGVEVTNGTDYQVEEGQASCHVTNKAGTIANATCVKYGNQQAMTSGTLTVTVAISAANPAVISINANSSLTPSAGYPKLVYEAVNLTGQALVIP